MAAESKPMTEAQVIKTLAEATNLTKKDVIAMFDTMREMVNAQMKKRGPGEFKIPKLGVKIRRIRKPATAERMGRNPATGKQVLIPAKPARQVIKATALKSLKEMLEA
jgi:nucleoid DNA-binding protein